MGLSQVDFAANEDTSTVCSLAEEVDVTGIFLPEGWTDASVGIEAALPDGTWATVRDETGAEFQVESTPPRRQGLGNLLPVRLPVAQGCQLRLTSGPMVGRVNQLADVTVTLLWRSVE
jgi:hypothetical protein